MHIVLITSEKKDVTVLLYEVIESSKHNLKKKLPHYNKVESFVSIWKVSKQISSRF